MSTFGRASHHSQREDGGASPRPELLQLQAQHHSSLKKSSRGFSRSCSPLMTLEEMIALTKQLQAEIQMYEVVIQTQGGASTSREHHSSQFLNQLGEIKEWCPRSLDAITKALENCRKRRHDDQGRSDSRDDIVGTLLYLKDKVLSIERKAVRVLERKTREVSGGSYERMAKDEEAALMQRGSAGTTSTATLRQDGRDNPFN